MCSNCFRHQRSPISMAFNFSFEIFSMKIKYHRIADRDGKDSKTTDPYSDETPEELKIMCIL